MGAVVFQRPDYDALKRQQGFSFSARAAPGAAWELAGVPIRKYCLQVDACIEAYRKGRPLIAELFGPDVGLPDVSTPHISYGHVNGLGSELIFPEGGEVGHTHIYPSLEEGILALRRTVDFAAAGMAPFYLDFRRKLQQAFPGEPVGFGFGLEGPITTAYELRGDGFFLDVMDRPELTAEFLALATESILQFHRFLCRLDGKDLVSPKAGYMADDIASSALPGLMRSHTRRSRTNSMKNTPSVSSSEPK